MTDPQITPLVTPEQITARIRELAAEISAAYNGNIPLVLGVLEDSYVFLADLLRAAKMSPQTVFLQCERHDFGGGRDLHFTTPVELKGRHVLLIEGVLATGVTQDYLIRQLQARGAAEVKLCVLADKSDRRRVALEADWRGFEVADDYVVGYGLGAHGRWRELPFLGKLEAGAETFPSAPRSGEESFAELS